MSQIIGVAALLLGAGLPVTYPLFRSWPLALPTAPLAAGLVSSAAVFGALLAESRLEIWLWIMFPLCWGITWLAVRRSVRTVAKVGWLHLCLLVVALLGPMRGLGRHPVDWDARSTYFFHAKWLYFGGGEAAVAAMRNPAFFFSGQDYPPLPYASSAFVYLVFDSPHPRLAQITISLLSWFAVITVCLSLCLLFNRKGSIMPAVMAGMIGLATFGIAGIGATNGYVDTLSAACLASAIVYLLVAPREPLFSSLGALCLAAAVLTKNEAATFGIFVAALAAIRQRDKIGRLKVLSSASLGVGWVVFVRHLGVRNSLAEAFTLSNFVRPSSIMRSRFELILEAFQPQIFAVLMVAVAVSLLGWATLADLRSSAGLGSMRWLWLSTLTYLAMLAAVYLMTPADLRWHLETSASRTLMTPKLFLLLEIAIWSIVGVQSMQRSPNSPNLASEVPRGPAAFPQQTQPAP